LGCSLVFAGEGQRGTLVVQTTPSNAQVYLDESTVAESSVTPFENASMIPGPHKVRLISQDQSFKPVTYQVLVEEGGTVTLQHTFEFRTQSFGVNHLSVAPWHFRTEAGFTYKRYLGVLGGDDFDPDSIPTSTEIPLQFHLGLPNGIEARLAFPFAWTSNEDGESSDASVGDVSVGLQYSYTPLRLGFAADWKIPRALPENLGENHNVLRLSAVTTQQFSGFDLFGNLAYEVHFNDLDSSRLDYGDHLAAYLRPGYLIKDLFLPYVGLRGDLKFEDQFGKEKLGNDGYQLSIEPGFILDIGKSVSLEFAVPLFLIGDKAMKGWGIHLGFSHELSFASGNVAGPNSAVGDAKAPQASAAGGIYAPVLFDAHEVTNQEYRLFCERNGRSLPPDPQFTDMPGYLVKPEYDRFPVVNVSLDDAKAYARWKGKRLPTLEEWKNEANGLAGKMAKSCGLNNPVSVDNGDLQNGSLHLVGNVAEWVIGGDAVGGTGYFAGGFYSLPIERCADTERLIDISSQTGSSLIGFRLVTDIR